MLGYLIKFQDGSYYEDIYNCELCKTFKKDAYIFESIEELIQQIEDSAYCLNKREQGEFIEIVTVYALPKDPNY